MPQQLTDEERIAVRLGQERVAEGHAFLGHLVAGIRLEQGEHVVTAEPGHREPLDIGLPMEGRECFGERMLRGDV